LIQSKYNRVFDPATFALLGNNKSKVIVTVLFSFIVSMWTLSLSPTSTVVGEIAYAQTSSNLSGGGNLSGGTTNETITLTRYLNPTFGIELNFPSSWVGLELWKRSTPSSSIVTFIPPAGNASADNASGFRDNLLISMQDSHNKTLNEYTNDSLNAYRDPANNVTITKSFPTTLTGIPAHEINYVENFEGNKLMKKQIWAIIDNRVYVVTYGADASQYADYLPDVDRMISSLKIARVPPELTDTQVGAFDARVQLVASNGLSQQYLTD
jgi:PsbP-like protein